MISARGSSTLYTRKRKQDQERKGHHMRFGKSANPDLDVSHQMGLYMDQLDIRPLTTCTKPARPHARCKCPPLFPRLATDSRMGPTSAPAVSKGTTSNIS